ncbi:MAG: T9SS type A sorting domain-containing protein [Sphingobacteriaceae bacterium]|nr:T9SS type A sorting domain-containing protein [Sphingobacteriaceae bacterium]
MKKLLLSLILGLLSLTSHQAIAQVVGFVTQPTAVRGNYTIGVAASGWGADLDTLTAVGQLRVLRSQGGTAVGDSLGCDTVLANPSALAGKIAVVYRGACEFGLKAYGAQRAGAIGVIIINNAAGVIDLGGGVNGINVTIPVVMISNADGATLRPFIDGDSTVAIIGQKRGQFANDFGFTPGNLVRPMDWAVPHTAAKNPGDYEVLLGAQIVNYGQNAQTNVNLNVKIDFTNPAGSTSTVYNQSNVLAALPIDSTLLITVPSFDPNAYGRGKYLITYNVTATNSDDFDGDNVVTQSFWLTDTLYSKARLDTAGNPIFSGGVRPSDAAAGPYEFGIWFYADRGHQVKVNKLKFSYVTNAGFQLINETVVGKVSQWLDVNTNGLIDPGEMIEMGEGFYTYTDSLGSASLRTVSITDIATNLPGVTLDSNGVYLFSMSYTGAQTGVFTSIDPQGNYTASSDIYLQYTAPVFVAAWNPNGFGDDRVPAIVAIVEEVPETSSVNEIRNDLSIRVYPNPVRDELNIRIHAENAIGEVRYDVMDIAGRIVMSGSKMVDGLNDQMTLSVGQLQEGLYTIVMKTNKGFNTSRFVVTK